LQAIYKENGVKLRNVFYGFAQVPFFIGMFFGLQAMASANVPGFATGGAFWFTDLTICDPTYILPTVASLAMLASIELGAEFAPNSAPKSPAMQRFMRFAAIASIPIMAYLPAVNLLI
jgi:YidC/Oxa1 family membrane protein insertase